MSKGGKPRAYSPVNVVGRILNDPNIFRRMQGGENQSFRGLVIVTHFIIKRANA